MASNQYRLQARASSRQWQLLRSGVSNDHVVETSLGYFIGPLVNVLLGVVLLSEELTAAQWTAFAAGRHGRINPLPGQHAERK